MHAYSNRDSSNLRGIQVYRTKKILTTKLRK